MPGPKDRSDVNQPPSRPDPRKNESPEPVDSQAPPREPREGGMIGEGEPARR